MPRERSTTSEEFRKRKRELGDRWNREGVSREAKECLATVMEDLRGRRVNGRKLTANEVVQAAWDAAEAAYPPLTEEEIRARREAKKAEEELVEERSEEEGPAAEGEGGTIPTVVIAAPPEEPRDIKPRWPAKWPRQDELPGSVRLEDEVNWAYENASLAICKLTNGQTVLKLWKCCEPPPSRGALLWMDAAMNNPKAFQDTVAKVKMKPQDDPEAARRERKSIEEIERILDRMEEAT